MKNTDHKIAKQIIKDMNNWLKNYTDNIEKGSHYSIDFVFSVAVSDPEETLEGYDLLKTSNFEVAELLINGLHTNNVASLISEGTTMCEFFNRYNKDGLC